MPNDFNVGNAVKQLIWTGVSVGRERWGGGRGDGGHGDAGTGRRGDAGTRRWGDAGTGRGNMAGWRAPARFALVPGRPAPKLVTAEAVEGMKPGWVIVDLAGETGGNCALTEPGETVVRHDVKIVSPLNLPASMPEHSSQLFARNVLALLDLLVGDDGALHLDFDDEIVSGACIVRDGEIVHPGAKAATEASQ